MPQFDSSIDSAFNVRPASGPAPSRTVTPTRRAITSTIPMDYKEVCKQLENALQKVHELVQAKADLEMMASVCRIPLDGTSSDDVPTPT